MEMGLEMTSVALGLDIKTRLEARLEGKTGGLKVIGKARALPAV